MKKVSRVIDNVLNKGTVELGTATSYYFVETQNFAGRPARQASLYYV